MPGLPCMAASNQMSSIIIVPVLSERGVKGISLESIKLSATAGEPLSHPGGGGDAHGDTHQKVTFLSKSFIWIWLTFRLSSKGNVRTLGIASVE